MSIAPGILSRASSKSNFVDTGDHRESPLQALVGAGLQVCVPAPKCKIFEQKKFKMRYKCQKVYISYMKHFLAIIRVNSCNSWAKQ